MASTISLTYAQKISGINRRFLEKRRKLFYPLRHALQQFKIEKTEKNFVELLESVENVFEAWYPENEVIPSLTKVEIDKGLKRILKHNIHTFVEELEMVSAVEREPLTVFWRTTLKQMLELMYLPRKKNFLSRVTQFVTRWRFAEKR
jgi:hypothetical protein